MPENSVMSKKRRREPYNVDVKLVEIYEDLANERDEVKLKAAQELLSRFTSKSNPTEEQVQKTLQRLFRGLCSGRRAARVGFSIALTELLGLVFSPHEEPSPSNLNIPKVLDIWHSQTDATGGDSGQEIRDHHFGRLFGAEAIIRSGILFRPDVPLKEWTRLLTLVFDLAKEKPWLREECGWIVYCFIIDGLAGAKFVQMALHQLCSNGLACTPEGVSVWIAAKDAFPDVAYPENVWKYDDPLNAHNKSSLARIMKESSVPEGDSRKEGGIVKQSGVWNSKLHFAWNTILTKIYDGESEQKKSKDKALRSSRISFVDFWIEVVDSNLFAASSSEERKYWGFLLFIKVLDEAPSYPASLVFTRNLTRCLMNQLAVEDRYLHRLAVKAAKSVQSRVSNEPDFAATAVSGLLESTGSVGFDRITRTGTIEKIVTEASPNALKQIVSLFERLIAMPGAAETQAAASSRQLLSGLLLSIIKSRSSASGEFRPIMEDILFVLVRFAYFTGQGNEKEKHSMPEPSLTLVTQQLFQTRIVSCLNSLIIARKEPATFCYAVIRKIRDSAKSMEFGKFIIELDDSIRESVKRAFKSLKKLSSKEKHTEKGKNASGVQAFRLLYAMAILQVYNGDADAVSMINELEFCYSRFWSDKKSKEDKSDASDALVEILLSFASKPSQLFRRMSEQVFGVFAGQVTANGLQSLTSILEAKENITGQEELFEQQEDEEMMDANSMGEDDDVEEVSADVSGTVSSNDGSSGVGDAASSSDCQDGDEDEDELAAFDAKLAKALGTHRADQDLNKGSDDSSDADMNDDEMEALDEQISKVFRARSQATSKKKDKKDAREAMINFKNRVLDLLEIYIKKCHSNILALDLLIPLLRLTRLSTVKQVSQKANVVLREYTKLCKGPALPALETANPVWELLKAIHEEAILSGPPAHASACSQASLLLVKILVGYDKSTISGVVDIYAATRKEQLLSKKCHVPPSFFTEWNNWCVSASKQLKLATSKNQ